MANRKGGVQATARAGIELPKRCFDYLVKCSIRPASQSFRFVASTVAVWQRVEKPVTFLHNRLDARRYFLLCLRSEPLFTGMDWMPLSCATPALANAPRCRKGDSTGLPGNIAGLLIGGFDDLQAVAFHCAARCGAQIFFVTKLHALVTFFGKKPPTFCAQRA